jgi:hypothetical protein
MTTEQFTILALLFGVVPTLAGLLVAVMGKVRR